MSAAFSFLCTQANAYLLAGGSLVRVIKGKYATIPPLGAFPNPLRKARVHLAKLDWHILRLTIWYNAAENTGTASKSTACTAQISITTRAPL